MKAKPMKAPKMVVPGAKGALPKGPKGPKGPQGAKPANFNRFPPGKAGGGTSGGNPSY